MSYFKDGIFLAKFQDPFTALWVKKMGPWCLNNDLILLKKCKHDA